MPISRRRREPVAPASSRAKHRSVTAAARRVDLSNREEVRREGRRAQQQWQKRAWGYFDDVPEVKYTVGYFGNLVAKLVLFAAVDDPTDDRTSPIPLLDVLSARLSADGDERIRALISEEYLPTELISAAIRELSALRCDYGGQPEILRRLNMNLEVVGEAWIYGRAPRNAPVPPTGWDSADLEWDVKSIDEVEFDQDGHAKIKCSPSDAGELVAEGDELFRVWQRHARWSDLADCAMRGVIGECETLVVLEGQVRAESRSRRPAGILTIPNEITVGPSDPVIDETEEPTEDPVMKAIDDAYSTAAEDPDDVSTVAPLVLRGPSEALTGVRHVATPRTSDETLSTRIEQRVTRIARGMNMPVEVALGHQETTYANAEQVDQNIYDDHVDPRALLLVDAISCGYLRPRLLARGFPEELVARIITWYDPSTLVRQPDTEANALEVWERGLITDETARRALGYGEDDAPTTEEILARTGLRRGILTAELTQALIEIGGTPIPVKLPPTQGTPSAAPPGMAVLLAERLGIEPGDVAHALAAGAARRSPRPLPARVIEAVAVPVVASSSPSAGRRLVDIDRDLRARLLVLADRAMARVLELAGNRVANRAKGEAKAVAASCSREELCRTLGRPLVAAIGYGEDDLIGDDAFDALEATFKQWVTRASDDALQVVEEVTGGIASGDRLGLGVRRLVDLDLRSTQIDESWLWLRNRLVGVARDELFSGSLADALEAGAEFDPTLRVAPAIVRRALGMAGGARIETLGTADAWVVLGSKPPSGVATGPTVLDAARGAGATIDAYRWDYGQAPRHTFEPHKRLDGVVFRDFDDEALRNTHGFPPFSHFFPGDHRGCLCDAEPIVLPAGDLAAAPAPTGAPAAVPAAAMTSDEMMREHLAGRWQIGNEVIDKLAATDAYTSGNFDKNRHFKAERIGPNQKWGLLAGQDSVDVAQVRQLADSGLDLDTLEGLPVVITSVGDTGYDVIVDGHHRYLAAMERGIDVKAYRYTPGVDVGDMIGEAEAI